MINSRHIGYFILHTVKPALEDIDKILENCKNIRLSPDSVKWMLSKTIELELKKSIIYCLTYIIISLILGVTCYFILR